jgi:hypothetical protein
MIFSQDLGDFDSDTVNFINAEYVLKRTNDVKELRTKLKHIRHLIADQYAERIGDNISCITQ